MSSYRSDFGCSYIVPAEHLYVFLLKPIFTSKSKHFFSPINALRYLIASRTGCLQQWKVPEHDLKPFEQKSSVHHLSHVNTCPSMVTEPNPHMLLQPGSCSPEGAGKDQDAGLGLSGVPAFLSWSFPAISGVHVPLHSEGSSENTVKKCIWQSSLAKSSMELIRDKLKIWVIHKIWKGRDIIFWHRPYKCLLGLVDDPVLQLWLTNISVLPCRAWGTWTTDQPQPWISALSWAGMSVLSVGPGSCYSALWIEGCCLSALNSSWDHAQNLPGWDEGTAELLLCASITAHTVAQQCWSLEIWSFFPASKTHYHAYLPIQA